MTDLPDAQHPTEKLPTALLLCDDLMFAVSLQNMARACGYAPRNLRPGMDLSDAPVLVVDLGYRGDWASRVREAASAGIYVVAFGPHMDGEARRKAKAAGANRVLANSNLQRDLPGILNAAGKAGREVADVEAPPVVDPV